MLKRLSFRLVLIQAGTRSASRGTRLAHRGNVLIRRSVLIGRVVATRAAATRRRHLLKSGEFSAAVARHFPKCQERGETLAAIKKPQSNIFPLGERRCVSEARLLRAFVTVSYFLRRNGELVVPEGYFPHPPPPTASRPRDIQPPLHFSACHHRQINFDSCFRFFSCSANGWGRGRGKSYCPSLNED